MPKIKVMIGKLLIHKIIDFNNIVIREDLDKRLLAAYSTLMDDLIKYRTNRMKLTTNHPIILLCIRVTTESTFRICYQGFGKTKYFSIFCNKMSSLVSYLFDPESDVLSKLPPIECKSYSIIFIIIIESNNFQRALKKERLWRS